MLRLSSRVARPLMRLRAAPLSTKGNKNSAKQEEEVRITPRSTDYMAWYGDVLDAADMMDSSPVRGCMIIRPWGMGVWDQVRNELDARIRASGTDNAYFPLFIPLSFLAKEAEHVDGFAKECAVVTHHRLVSETGLDGRPTLVPDPEAKLEEPLVIRPTSETIIWKSFSKWVVSHRDLPLKINQWANVVRWEMRTRPFLRTSEFLWQEGHTAHATETEARGFTKEILDMYAAFCEEHLALPTVKGLKSPSERFAGAEDTYTIEAVMQNGWALQSGTSHFLGQNFSKAFDVSFIDPAAKGESAGQRQFAWATSWGVSTRLIGALVMTHSDDKGLVLPPRVAPLQVVLVPIQGKGPIEGRGCKELLAALQRRGIRAKIDSRDHLRPGSKFYEWERKGVPIRIDVGPRDLTQGSANMSIRYNGTKVPINISDDSEFAQAVETALGEIQEGMLANAKKFLESKIIKVQTYDELKRRAESAENDLGFFLVPWKCNAENEEAIKQETKMTIRCYPLDLNNTPPESQNCFYSGEKATHWAIFARNF